MNGLKDIVGLFEGKKAKKRDFCASWLTSVELLWSSRNHQHRARTMPLPLSGVEKAWSIDRRCSSVPVSILLLLGLLVGTHGGGAAALSPIQCDLVYKWLYVSGRTACRAVAEEMEKLPGVDSEIYCVSKSFLEHDVLMFPSSVFFLLFFPPIMIHPTSIILYHHVCRSSSIIMLYQYE